MTPVLIFMSVVVVVAVLALAYAAWPHRGEPVPGAAWIGEAVERAADAVPTVEDGDLDPADDAVLHPAGDAAVDPADGPLDEVADQPQPSHR